jgi:tyrosyl-DNA phosphodiesterase-1
MIHMDWTNMTQAVWRSPLLPLQKTIPSGSQPDTKFGSGARFKRDILAYLKAYGAKKTGRLVQQLNNYDFGAIRAALIASVPSKKNISDCSSEEDTLWGWPALKDTMRRIPIQQKKTNNKKPHIVIQVRPLPPTHHYLHIQLPTTPRSHQSQPSAKQTNGSKKSSSKPSPQRHPNHNQHTQ